MAEVAGSSEDFTFSSFCKSAFGFSDFSSCSNFGLDPFLTLATFFSAGIGAKPFFCIVGQSFFMWPDEPQAKHLPFISVVSCPKVQLDPFLQPSSVFQNLHEGLENFSGFSSLTSMPTVARVFTAAAVDAVVEPPPLMPFRRCSSSHSACTNSDNSLMAG